MREFRPLTEETLDDATRILRNAYPVAGLPGIEEHRESLQATFEKEHVHLWTVHGEGEVLGVLRTHDFMMNAFGRQIPVQGLGGVAVDLRHKKKKVAKDLVLWFLERSCEQGAALTALYPFRISFYERMGWGAGTPTHRFQLAPASFPDVSCEGQTRYLGEGDEDALCDYLNRIQEQIHGHFKIPRRDMKFPDAGSGFCVVGVEFDGQLEAHATFKFEPRKEGNLFAQDIEVWVWTYSTTRGLHGLLRFFRTQGDQVSRVRLLTQDAHLQHLFSDPLDGSDNHFRLNHQISERGSGVMYRMVDPARLFEQLADHNFGGVDLTCGIDLQDGFWEKTSGSFDLQIEGGRARMLPGPSNTSARLKIGVGNLTSVLLGSVPLRRLLEFGIVELSDPALQAPLEAAFAVREAPRCNSWF